MHPQWDASIKVGLPLFISFEVICVAAVLFLVVLWIMGMDWEDFLFFAVWPTVPGLIVAGIGAAVYWPYEGQYFEHVPKAGIVSEVDSRLMSDGDKGMQQRFVVTYASGEQYGCDDTRCASVKVGDRLTLMCEKEYQFTGTEGWACNWGERVPASK